VTAKDKLAGTQKHVWYKITWRQSLYFYHIFIYLSFPMLAAWSPAVGCQIEGLIRQSGQRHILCTLKVIHVHLGTLELDRYVGNEPQSIQIWCHVEL
jgi:hypothetical protein